MKTNKILCVAKNYLEHAKEMGGKVPKVPVFFLKPFSSIVKEPNAIRLKNNGHDVGYEG